MRDWRPSPTPVVALSLSCRAIGGGTGDEAAARGRRRLKFGMWLDHLLKKKGRAGVRRRGVISPAGLPNLQEGQATPRTHLSVWSSPKDGEQLRVRRIRVAILPELHDAYRVFRSKSGGTQLVTKG